MISSCSRLTPTLNTWTTPWKSAPAKPLCHLASLYQALLSLASTTTAPNTPSQFRRFCVLLARLALCFLLPCTFHSTFKYHQIPFPISTRLEDLPLPHLLFFPGSQLCEGQSGAGVGPVHVEDRRFDASPWVPAAPALLATFLRLWGIQTDLQGLRHPLHHWGSPWRKLWLHHHPGQGEP